MKRVFLTFFAVVLTVAAHADNLTLCYHKFEYAMTDLYSVLPEEFEWQIKYMKEKGLDIIRLKRFTDFYADGAGSIDKTALITIDDGWKSVNDIIPLAVKYNAPVTLYLYKLVLGRSEHYLSFADIDAIKASGIADFGCHSYSHIPLIKKDDAVLEHEIRAAKKAVEEVVGMPLDTFAYPYGMFDDNAKKKAAECFKLVMGVNDGWNNASTDRYNLNRFVIYKSTGLGEFKSIVDHAAGLTVTGHKVHFIGTGRDEEGRYNRIKFKVYQYPPERLPKTALIVPSSGAGPAWAVKLVPALNAAGFECHVVSGRYNYIPFYNPDKVVKVVKDWGMGEAVGDIKAVLNYPGLADRRPVVIAWGDGFDAVMAAAASDPTYAARLRCVIAVNPSLASGVGDVDRCREAAAKYQSMVDSGEYEASDLELFLKAKTLMDMAVLKPGGRSPFGKKLGYPGAANEDVLVKFLNSQANPEVGLDRAKMETLLPDFGRAEMQPMPIFGMVVPARYMMELNRLWYGDFYSEELGITGARETGVRLCFYYTPAYEGNVKAAVSAFGRGGAKVLQPWKSGSTVEMLLDSGLIGAVTTTASALQ